LRLAKTIIRGTICVAWLAVPTTVAAHEAELDLRLREVKSIQVAGGIVMAPLFRLPIEEPFEEALAKHGIKVDSRNQENVLSVLVEVTTSGSGADAVYAVGVSSAYRELCKSERLERQLMCDLWARSESPRAFRQPAQVEDYIRKTLASQAEGFAAEIGGR
jgi:hypothetical protein